MLLENKCCWQDLKLGLFIPICLQLLAYPVHSDWFVNRSKWNYRILALVLSSSKIYFRQKARIFPFYQNLDAFLFLHLLIILSIKLSYCSCVSLLVYLPSCLLARCHPLCLSYLCELTSLSVVLSLYLSVYLFLHLSLHLSLDFLHLVFLFAYYFTHLFGLFVMFTSLSVLISVYSNKDYVRKHKQWWHFILHRYQTYNEKTTWNSTICIHQF